MPEVEFICLANSYKEKRRCVAGLRTDGSGWVRPVSQRVRGELEYRQYCYPDKSEPRVLDVIRAGLAEPRPLPHQPENWLINDTPWQPVERTPSRKYASLLSAALSRDPLLLGSDGTRVAASSFAGHPAPASLQLIQPANIHWHNLPPLATGKKRPRVGFQLGNAQYDLPLTDPAYVKTLNMLEPGEHPGRELWIPENRKLLFTLSLSEPFEGVCYKLVAAVIVLPAPWDPLF